MHKILISFFDSIQIDKQTGEQAQTICHRYFLYRQSLIALLISKVFTL